MSTAAGQDEYPSPAPPAMLGRRASPLGHGVFGGATFALLIAPMMIAIAEMDCAGLGCTAGPTWPLAAESAAALGGMALAFGLASAWQAEAWIAWWRAGKGNRPPLWAGFVAMQILGYSLPNSVAAPLVQLLAAF